MITLTDVSKVFPTGAAAISDINLSIEKGEFAFLVGHTGSGKTTLLKMLVREIVPTKGTITIGEVDILKLPQNKVPLLRKKIGVVFQDLKLLMDRTILENVLLPLEITGKNLHESRKRAEEVLSQVAMLEHRDKFPIQLSGGELQRVAIARALTLSPEIILADEPTGNLDAKTAFDIVELMAGINQGGTTVIMATHNMDILKKYPKNRVIGLEKGKLVRDQKSEKSASHKAEVKEEHEKKEEIKEEKKDEKEKKE